MADAGSAIQPARLKLQCPRCRFPSHFVPLAALVFRCTRCEWPFTLAAASVSTPAVPATTVAAANSTGTVVAVTISNGTLTSVVVNGSQAGTTAGTYLVPVGGTISITYTAAPTWAWALPVTSAAVLAGGTALPFTAGGTAFTVNQSLIVDPAGTSDLVVVNGAPTGTSVPVGALNSAHASGVSVTVAQASPQLSGVEAVPQNAY
jgi:ribosomal protein L37AE/L43A